MELLIRYPFRSRRFLVDNEQAAIDLIDNYPGAIRYDLLQIVSPREKRFIRRITSMLKRPFGSR